LKKLGFLVFALVSIAIAISGKRVSALEALITYKEVPLTVVVVAASPAAYTPSNRPGGVQVAGISSYDVPMGILPPTVIAQTTGQQGNTPVKFLAKPDPTYTYLHEIPINPTITAPAGSTTYAACPFEMYAYYKAAYYVTDYGYGTASSGSGPFPIFNYPQNSDLSWTLTAVGVPPAANATYTLYYNKGTPGQTAFTGTAGEAQTQCLNLELTVPAGTAVGTYTAVITYLLYST
jgi:hypothetical protein